MHSPSARSAPTCAHLWQRGRFSWKFQHRAPAQVNLPFGVANILFHSGNSTCGDVGEHVGAAFGQPSLFLGLLLASCAIDWVTQVQSVGAKWHRSGSKRSAIGGARVTRLGTSSRSTQGCVPFKLQAEASSTQGNPNQFQGIRACLTPVPETGVKK